MGREIGLGGAIVSVTWSAAFGVALRHWRVFRECAVRHGVYILLRAGQRAAIPWIERDFPTVPPELKPIGVDAELGLVIAREGAGRDRIFAFGHYVLAPVVSGSPEFGLLAVNPRQPPLGSVFRDRWARAGVVIDRRTHRPFTEGYDIAALIEADENGRNSERVRRELADRIGRERIRYATGHVRVPAAEPHAAGASGVPGDVLAFGTRGSVFVCTAGPGRRSADIAEALRSLERQRGATV